MKNDTRRGPFLPMKNDCRMKSLGEETFSCHCCISLVYQYMVSLGISSGSDRQNVSTKEFCKKKNITEFSFSTQQNLICFFQDIFIWIVGTCITSTCWGYFWLMTGKTFRPMELRKPLLSLILLGKWGQGVICL